MIPSLLKCFVDYKIRINNKCTYYNAYNYQCWGNNNINDEDEDGEANVYQDYGDNKHEMQVYFMLIKKYSLNKGWIILLIVFICKRVTIISIINFSFNSISRFYPYK